MLSRRQLLAELGAERLNYHQRTSMGSINRRYEMKQKASSHQFQQVKGGDNPWNNTHTVSDRDIRLAGLGSLTSNA